MVKTKLITIAASLILIFTALAFWADNTMYNLNQRINKQSLSVNNSKGTFVKPSPRPEVSQSPNESTSLVRLAKADAAQKFNLDEADIKVEQLSQISWNDSSLGCPKPEGVYLQVITPGWKIKLNSGNNIYEYHSDQSRVIYCDNPKE